MGKKALWEIPNFNSYRDNIISEVRQLIVTKPHCFIVGQDLHIILNT